jgi:hypothetical protein
LQEAEGLDPRGELVLRKLLFEVFDAGEPKRVHEGGAVEYLEVERGLISVRGERWKTGNQPMKLHMDRYRPEDVILLFPGKLIHSQRRTKRPGDAPNSGCNPYRAGVEILRRW